MVSRDPFPLIRITDIWDSKPPQSNLQGPFGLRHRGPTVRTTPLLQTAGVWTIARDRLVGQVVRRPPRERKIPGSNPACAGIFSGSSHTSDLKIGTPVATNKQTLAFCRFLSSFDSFTHMVSRNPFPLFRITDIWDSKPPQSNLQGPFGLRHRGPTVRTTPLLQTAGVWTIARDRLVGQVVRRPPRERKILGSNPACAGIFSGSSHTSDFKFGTPVATLSGA